MKLVKTVALEETQDSLVVEAAGVMLVVEVIVELLRLYSAKAVTLAKREMIVVFHTL